MVSLKREQDRSEDARAIFGVLKAIVTDEASMTWSMLLVTDEARTTKGRIEEKPTSETHPFCPRFSPCSNAQHRKAKVREFGKATGVEVSTMPALRNPIGSRHREMRRKVPVCARDGWIVSKLNRWLVRGRHVETLTSLSDLT